MSMAYIRRTYGVPVKRGARIRFDYADYGEGVITSAPGPHLRVRFADGRVRKIHPTWHVTYLDGPES